MAKHGTKIENKKQTKRISMNVFEEVRQRSDAVNLNGKNDVVIKCLSLALQILINDIEPATTFAFNFQNVLATKEMYKQFTYRFDDNNNDFPVLQSLSFRFIRCAGTNHQSEAAQVRVFDNYVLGAPANPFQSHIDFEGLGENVSEKNR